MNLEEILPKIENTGDFGMCVWRFRNNLVLLDRLMSALVSMQETLKGSFFDFYNNIRVTKLPLPVVTELTKFAATKVSATQDAYNQEIFMLPKVISGVMGLSAEGNEIRAGNEKITPSLVELFFMYAQRDPEYLNGPILSIDATIKSFQKAMKRLYGFFLQAPPHMYERLLATRDLTYEKNWDLMIASYRARYAVEGQKPREQKNIETRIELGKNIVQCRQMKKYEDEENINLTYLSRISEALYRALDLTQTIDFYNNLRSSGLPLPIEKVVSKYFLHRNGSDADKKDLEKLPLCIRDLLKANEIKFPADEFYRGVEDFFKFAFNDSEKLRIPVSQLPDVIEAHYGKSKPLDPA